MKCLRSNTRTCRGHSGIDRSEGVCSVAMRVVLGG